MQRYIRTKNHIKLFSLLLGVLIVSAFHSDAVLPQSAHAGHIQRISRNVYGSELPQTQHKAITSQGSECGVVDKKHRRAKLEHSLCESHVTQISFYLHITTYHPAPHWYLVMSRQGKIHSLHYA